MTGAETRPSWVDREQYPFQSRWFETGHGRMHYVDEGIGLPVVMLHGNPSWSFEYRHLIRGLTDSYRCIAVDHLGFGLSDKPPSVEYTAALHGGNLARLIDSLKLDRLVLVGGDWGGPIGLSYAIHEPERVKAVIISNTWAWPIAPSDLYYQGFSRIVGGPLGRLLVRRYNVFVERILPAAFGRKQALTAAALHHYRAPLAAPPDRKACWSFPGQIVGARDWLDEIWSRQGLFRHLPFLVLWGEKDMAFRRRELNRWCDALTRAEIHTLPGVGHWVAEEAHEEALPLIRRFLEAHVSGPHRRGPRLEDLCDARTSRMPAGDVRRALKR